MNLEETEQRAPERASGRRKKDNFTSTSVKKRSLALIVRTEEEDRLNTPSDWRRPGNRGDALPMTTWAANLKRRDETRAVARTSNQSNWEQSCATVRERCR